MATPSESITLQSVSEPTVNPDWEYQMRFPVRALTGNISPVHLSRHVVNSASYGLGLLVIGLIVILFSILFESLVTKTAFGIIMLIIGILAIAYTILILGAPATYSSLLLAILSLAGGLWIILPSAWVGSVSLGIILPSWFLAQGIGRALLSIELRSISTWIMVLVSAGVALILSALLAFTYKNISYQILGVLVGVDLTIFSIAMFFISMMAHYGHRIIESVQGSEPLLGGEQRRQSTIP